MDSETQPKPEEINIKEQEIKEPDLKEQDKPEQEHCKLVEGSIITKKIDNVAAATADMKVSGVTAVEHRQEESKTTMIEKKTKIDVLLKAAGDAPIMKKKKWAVESNKQVAYLTQFIRKYIKCEPDESLFLYVNQTFVPSPDQVLSNLFDCFGTDGKLVLHYCKSQAWG